MNIRLSLGTIALCFSIVNIGSLYAQKECTTQPTQAEKLLTAAAAANKPETKVDLDFTLEGKDDAKPSDSDAVVNGVKDLVLGRMTFPELNVTGFPTIPSEINEAIQKGDFSDINFIRTSTREGVSEGLQFTRIYRMKSKSGGLMEVVVNPQLSKGDPSDASAQPVQLEITAEFYEDGVLKASLDDTIQYENSGKAHFSNRTMIVFDHKTEAKDGRVSLQKTSVSADGGIESDKKIILGSLLKGKKKLDDYEQKNSYPDNESFREFEDYDSTDIRTSIQFSGQTELLMDPFVHKVTSFKIYKVEATQGENPFASEVIIQSPLSSFNLQKAKVITDPSKTNFQEAVTKDDWKATKVSQLEVPKSDSFTFDEVHSPALKIAVETDREIPVDDFSAYGKIEKLDSNQGVKYLFVSEKSSSAQPLKPIDIGHYTKDTAFYDYKSPEVAAIVDSIKAKDLKTKKEMAEAALREVTSKVEYSYGMLDEDTVRPMKASDVIREKKGVCQNFSALYVAVARGLGIPSRSIWGLNFGSGDPKDKASAPGGHAWVEISLDNKSWTPVEPQLQDLSLPNRGYLPLGEVDFLEQSVGGDLDLSKVGVINDLIGSTSLKHAASPSAPKTEKIANTKTEDQ